MSPSGTIISEVIGATALNLSNGFTELVPSIIVVLGYGGSFYLLSLALTDLPVGMIYATWSGVGVVLIAVIGIVFFDEQIDTAGVLGFGLIIASVYLLNVVHIGSLTGE
jgi:small multidrug resistance pump